MCQRMPQSPQCSPSSVEFGEFVNEREDEVGLRRVNQTLTIDSSMFFAGCELVCRLAGVLDFLMHWSESCECHEPLLWGLMSSNASAAQIAALSLELEDPARHQTARTPAQRCKMAGMRAPFMAAGHFVHIAKLSLESGKAIFVSKLAEWHVNAEHTKEMTMVYEFGAAFILSTLTTKLQFWRAIPHHLAILAHADGGVAATGAAECLAQYDKTPVADVHHRLPHLNINPATTISQQEQWSFLDSDHV